MFKLLNSEEMISRDYYFDFYVYFGIYEVNFFELVVEWDEFGFVVSLLFVEVV